MTLTNLRAKSRFILGDLGTDNYSNTNLDAALNDYYFQAIAIALKASGDWQVNGEIATTDLVANQQEYVLPTTLIDITKIEANFLGGTLDWTNLNIQKGLRGEVISNDNAQSATTAINECDLYDNSIFLRYKPLSAVTGGLKIWYSKEATALSDVGDEPALAEHLQLYLVYGACCDYALRTENTQDYNTYIQLLLKKEDEIKTHYSNRESASKPRITTRRENYN